MKGRVGLIISLTLLAGCQTLSHPPKENSEAKETVITEQIAPTPHSPPCRLMNDSEGQEQLDCDFEYLLGLYKMANKTPWSMRKHGIQSTYSDATQMLLNLALAHPADTPYQTRLRAQQWLTSTQYKFSESTREWLAYCFGAINQRLLQLESESVILRRELRVTEEALRKAQNNVEAQEKQIRALLQIEASLLNKEGQ